jgi:hypothetical protein
MTAFAALVVLAGAIPIAGAEVAGRADALADNFTVVNPTRVMDTRTGFGGGRLGPGETRVVALAGAGMPSGAFAASLNVTAVDASAVSFLSVWRAGAAQPPTSSLNFAAGEVRAGAVVAEVGGTGEVSIFNAAGDVDVVVDVTGWLGDGFNPVAPARLLDTRTTTPIADGGSRSVLVAGNAGVPGSGAIAAAVTVTVTNPAAAGFVTVWPEGTSPPGTSTVNFDVGETLAATVLVGLGPSGGISLAAAGSQTDVIVDLVGWFSAGYTALAQPARLLDTRDGTGRCGLFLRPGDTRTISVAGAGGVPATGVGAAALNLTVTGVTGGGGVLTVWPAGQPRPLASNLNYRVGQTVANGVLVGLGTAGQVTIANEGGTAEVIVDVNGSFPGTTPGGTPAPCPSLTTSNTLPAPGRLLPDGTMTTLAFNTTLAELGVTPATSSPLLVALALTGTTGGEGTQISLVLTGGGATAVIDARRLGDDSVAGIHYEVGLQPVGGGAYRVAGATWGFNCLRRPSPPFSPELCP